MALQTDAVSININTAPLLKEVYAFSDKLGNRLAEKALREGGKYLANRIRANTPVRTGRLKGSVRLGKSKIHTMRRTGEVGIYVGVRTRGSKKQQLAGRSAFYGYMVENGTVFQRGQFFVANTWTAEKERTAQIIVTALDAGAQAVLNNIR